MQQQVSPCSNLKSECITVSLPKSNYKSKGVTNLDQQCLLCLKRHTVHSTMITTQLSMHQSRHLLSLLQEPEAL